MLHDSDSWLDVLQEGLGLARVGDYDRALDRFEHARALAPARAETACALGREQMRRGHAEEACELLRQAWQSDNSLITAGTSLARCLGLDLEELERAHAVLDEVDKLHPEEATSRIIRSELLLFQGRHEEAALLAGPLSEAPLRTSPNDRLANVARLLMSRVENERGLSAVSNGGVERAIFAFKRASDLDPAWAAPSSNLGAAFERLGKPGRAESAYQEALRRDPDYARAWHNLAKLYRRDGHSGADRCIAKAFRADAVDCEIAADYAIALLAQSKQDRALQALTSHAEALGDLSEAWAALAIPLAAGGAGALSQLCLHNAKTRCSNPALLSRTQAVLDSYLHSSLHPNDEPTT